MRPSHLLARLIFAATLAGAGSAVAQSVPARGVLTPEVAVARAAERNPGLRATLLDVRAAEAETRAVLDERAPTFFAGISGQYAEGLSTTIEGTISNASRRASANAGFLYVTDAGTQLSLELTTGLVQREANRDISSTTSFELAPTWGSDLVFSIRQPLLRGGGDARQASIASVRAAEQATRYRAQGEASTLVGDVLAAYWELWYAERALAVQRESRELVERQHREAQLRVTELGTLAPSEVLRFASELAAIDEALSTAEADRDVRAIELGRLLGLTPGEARRLTVAEAPPNVAEAPDAERAIELARQRSPELLAERASLEQTRQRVILAEDATEPQLDLYGSLTGSTLFSEDTPEYWQLPEDRPAITALVGVELELPIGSSAADASLSAARAQREAALARYEATIDAVEAQAATLVRRANAAERRVELATRTAELAEQLADAERRRLELGTSTPLELLEAQQSHREAELRLLRARVEHQAAVREVEHLTGALVARHASPSSDA